MLGINFYGSIDQYWSDLICGLPQAMNGEVQHFAFGDSGADGGGVFTPLPGDRIRLDRYEESNGPDDIYAPAISLVADRAALATALADGAQAWHDFCERTGEADYAGPIFQERIDAVRAAI